MTATVGSCVRNDYYMLPLTHKFMAQNYALLLSSKMAGKAVSITVDSGDCPQGLPRIKHLKIED